MDESDFQHNPGTLVGGSVNRLPTDESGGLEVVRENFFPLPITHYPLLTAQCFLPLDKIRGLYASKLIALARQICGKRSPLQGGAAKRQARETFAVLLLEQWSFA